MNTHRHKILNIPTANLHLQKSLSNNLGISAILSQVLINRGIKTVSAAQEFLGAKLNHLLDPYSFKDMHAAVNRIRKAVANKEKILVCGDYDVDGITSLALFKSTLSKMNAQVLHYLPHRVKDGYGLNAHALRLAKEKHVSLVITVDCGTNDHEHVAELRRQHSDVIVTDHHELSGIAPAGATHIINPKLKTSGYAFRDLAGVGVAYKLCQALTGETLFSDLDLVTLGTIADVAPLRGENRIIAKEGLRRLTDSKRIGLMAIMESSGIKGKKMTSTSVSFILGPRLNASGRIDTAEISLNLLLSDNTEEAQVLARTIEAHNRQRQKEEAKILQEAQDIIDREINFKEHRVIVLAKEDWHQGVLGVVASKLADKYYRPTIIISLSGECGKGSGRSIKNFHLFQALCECKDVLKTFGGHSHAVGLVIAKERIEAFKKQLNCIATKGLSLVDLLPALDIDMKVGFADLNDALVRELEFLEPFGEENPEPLFYAENVRLKGIPQVLGRNTLKFWVTDGKVACQAIGFGMGDFADELTRAESFDLVYTPRMDSWRQEESLILEVKDIFLK